MSLFSRRAEPRDILTDFEKNDMILKLPEGSVRKNFKLLMAIFAYGDFCSQQWLLRREILIFTGWKVTHTEECREGVYPSPCTGILPTDLYARCNGQMGGYREKVGRIRCKHT